MNGEAKQERLEAQTVRRARIDQPEAADAVTWVPKIGCCSPVLRSGALRPMTGVSVSRSSSSTT